MTYKKQKKDSYIFKIKNVIYICGPNQKTEDLVNLISDKFSTV